MRRTLPAGRSLLRRRGSALALRIGGLLLGALGGRGAAQGGALHGPLDGLGRVGGAAHAVDGGLHALARRDDVHAVRGAHPHRCRRLRVLGPSRGRGGNYSRTELEEWAARIKKWRREVEVFAYFNNDWKAYAVRNAKTLTSLV